MLILWMINALVSMYYKLKSSITATVDDMLFSILNGANRGSKAVLHALNKFGAGQKCGAHICT